MRYISQFFKMISRMFYWGYKLRNSHDWDYGYLDEIIALKLARIEREIRLNGHTVMAEKLRKKPTGLSKKLKICVELSRRVSSHDYLEQHFSEHKKKWGQTKLNSVPYKPGLSEFKLGWEKALTEEDNKKASKEFRRAGNRADKQEKLERDQLYDLLKKYGTSFWD